MTCVRMYDLVQKYWAAEIEALKIQIKHATQQETQELERKLQWMQETEMAVVISQEQNEIQTFQKWGLDIKTHREKMEKRELDKEFKDPANPLRVVFVCAMWLTGFDVKSLSEILGHATVNITLNRYVHPSMELKQQNMQKLSSLLAVI